MVIYAVSLYIQCLTYNICSTWFLDIRITSCLVIVMLYTEEFSMLHYVGLLQIGSHVCCACFLDIKIINLFALQNTP